MEEVLKVEQCGAMPYNSEMDNEEPKIQEENFNLSITRQAQL